VVENRFDRLIQSGDLHISDHAYYQVRSGIGSRITQTAPDRIAAREESVGQAFVDNDDAGSIRLVVFIEQASFDKRNAERLKIAFVGDADVGFDLLPGRRNRIAYDVEARRVSAEQRQLTHRARASHAWQRFESLHQSLVKINLPVGIAVFTRRQQDGHRL